jgi:hypothetical protein
MYPGRELAGLAERKTILLARIEVRRWETALAAAELARPVAMVDRGLEAWRKISPFVKLIGLPVTVLGMGKILRRVGRGKWSKLVALAPAVFRAAQTVMRFRAERHRASAGSPAMSPNR